MRLFPVSLFVACSYAEYHDLPLQSDNETMFTIRLHVPKPTPVRWTNSCVTSMPHTMATQMPNGTKDDHNTTTSIHEHYDSEADTLDMNWVVLYLTIIFGALAI